METKKILLIDVDSKIPNIALMKISTYYKLKGYVVSLKKLNYTYYPKDRNQSLINAEGYDRVFASIIFKINKQVLKIVGCNDVQIGGVGVSLNNDLPLEIDNCKKDYSLYPDNDCSYGFISRGCIRNCYFCVVPKKEGMIHQVNKIDDVIEHKKVIFMDNNILALPNHIEILTELRDKKIRCQFNQGIDIRLLNDNNAKLLSELKYIGEYFFAFDNIKDKELIKSKLDLFKKYVSKNWKVKMFLYCHPDMDIYNNVVYRINWCKENKVLPYLMRDQSCWQSNNREFYIDLCAYCNQVNLFKKLSFKEFMKKRTKNIQRQEKSIGLYYDECYGGVCAQAFLSDGTPYKLPCEKHKSEQKELGLY